MRDAGCSTRPLRAADRVLDAGPSLVAFAVPGQGDLVTWRGSDAFFPFGDEPVVDVTGAGDAFVAGLVQALRDGAGPEEAGRRAAGCAAATVGRLGARPDYDDWQSGQ